MAFPDVTSTELQEPASSPLSDTLKALVSQPPSEWRDERRAARDRLSLLERLLSQPGFVAALCESPAKAAQWLSQVIVEIDEVLTRQINAILHHPSFQRLEASWRGIEFLHRCMLREDSSNIKLRVLSVSWKELENDFQSQVEFDQNQLFRLVYEQEFDQAGGEPYGVLIGDFEITPQLSKDHPHDDMAILHDIGQVAAAAFCPFVAGVSPQMFGQDDFAPLERTVDLDRFFRDRSFFRWNKLREEEDSRFLALAMPRMLMRLPYGDNPSRRDGFRFREDVEGGEDASRYLWGNPAYAFAAVLIRSFGQTGWFVDTRGVVPGIDGGGLVAGLPVASFSTDSPGIAVKPSTDLMISDNLERMLSELGFLPLCACQDTEYCAFFSNRSIQKPRRYSSAEANASARMSTMLQYMLCVSRFAHYLKVMARDLLGSMETDDLERHLNNWLADFICDADSAPEVKARRPLEAGRVRLSPELGKPGSYRCLIDLKPHFEYEQLAASVRLSTVFRSPAV